MNRARNDTLEQVKQGIDYLGQPVPGKKAGLMISEVNVSFNIAAGEKNSTELKLDLSPGGVIKEIPSGSFGSSASYEETRGNQISFKFQSIAFANEDSRIGIVSAMISGVNSTQASVQASR